jgi:tetratricopeptide (TPR) repeat protein
LVLSLPLVALLLLELVLRLVGYGYPTAFFSEIRGPDSKMYLRNNDTFSSRFFPPHLERWAEPFLIPAQKPRDVCRLFVFGESAAMGDPQPSYGASRYLEVLLRERFPGQKFEVVNLGITAVNSHVILPIAQACAQRQGDIWIVYMGNNEMVGPFGAATIFGWRAPPLPLVRFYLAAQKTRVGQLAVALSRRVGKQNDNLAWGGMKMFLQNEVQPTDPRKDRVYRNFESNLRHIVAAGLDSGAKVVLSTMSVNLRDCPPFASAANSNLPAADLKKFQDLYAEALRFQQATNHTEAAHYFEQAAQLDPRFAELQFRWADCLLALTNAAAREHFQLACDSDALPFRADSRINAAIRAVASKFAAERLALCDAEVDLQRASPVAVAGDDSFFEHVHFNFDGNYRLARAWAEQVRTMMRLQSAPGGDWITQDECERQLGLTDFNRAYVLQAVSRRMEQPPLSKQFNNRQRAQRIQAEEAAIQARLQQPDAPDRARDLFLAALSRSPDDHHLQEGFGNFLESVADYQAAAVAYRRALELRPQDFYVRLRLGCVLAKQGQFSDGIELLRQAATLRPAQPEAWHELAAAQVLKGDYDEALKNFDRACALRPRDPTSQYDRLVCNGKRLAKLNRHTEAIEQYQKAIELLPQKWEAHFELGGEMDAANRLDEAERQFNLAVQLNPGYSRTHFNHGVLLAKREQFEAAEKEFQETIRLEPGYASAHDYLAKVRQLKH